MDQRCGGEYRNQYALFISGAYDGNLVLGHYGVDVANGSVRAVINHNSEFTVVPEPGTCALLLLGGLVILAAPRGRAVRI